MQEIKETELPHNPLHHWDDEQKRLIATYLQMIEAQFYLLPGNERFYFSHAAEVLRHVARSYD